MLSVTQLEPFQNRWIAVSHDQKMILASGESIKEVVQILHDQKITDGTLSYIPSAHQPLAPYVNR